MYRGLNKYSDHARGVFEASDIAALYNRIQNMRAYYWRFMRPYGRVIGCQCLRAGNRLKLLESVGLLWQSTG